MQMDGREVFMFAVKSVPQAVKEVLEKNNVAQEEISFYILHQANKRIVEAIAKRLGRAVGKISDESGRIRKYIFRKHSDSS